MKRLINQVIDVNIGCDMLDVDSVEFIFKQSGHVVRKVTYPSDDAYLNGSSIYVRFPAKTTEQFSVGRVQMDTRIHMKNSTINPETEIVELDMKNTLFDEPYIPIVSGEIPPQEVRLDG